MPNRHVQVFAGTAQTCVCYYETTNIRDTLLPYLPGQSFMISQGLDLDNIQQLFFQAVYRIVHSNL